MFLIFSSSCTKVSMSYWVGWLRHVGHTEEKRKERYKGHLVEGAEEKEILVEAKSK